MRRSSVAGSLSSFANGTQGGFTLIVVVWALAIISLLCLTFVATSRARLQTASHVRNALQAELAATSVAQLALYRLLSPQTGAEPGPSTFSEDGAPRYCRLANAVTVAISLEDEGGKIDLNGAPQNLLQALLEGFGVDKRRAGELATNIVDFRSVTSSDSTRITAAYRGAALPAGPKAGLFQTTYELDQVLGIDQALYKRLLPFLTTRSESSGVDPATAPPALFAALAGASVTDVALLEERPFPNALDRNTARFPAAFIRASTRGALLAHVEAILPGGTVYAHEEIWDLRSGALTSMRREVRRAPIRFLGGEQGRTPDRGDPQLPRC
jgi:general secretion pathway protein K